MIILASSNKGKIKELKKMFNQDIIAYEDILGKFEIEETGNSFKQNAIIKSETVFEKLENLKDN